MKSTTLPRMYQYGSRGDIRSDIGLRPTSPMLQLILMMMMISHLML
jgi:hypothetical protein